MVKEFKEIKTVTKIEEIITREQAICDVCGKIFYDSNNPQPKTYKERAHGWQVTTHHHDWGNDSCDSYEEFYCCSPECLEKKLDEYIEVSNDPYSTNEFEVKKVRF